jgi:hypothetical protein
VGALSRGEEGTLGESDRRLYPRLNVPMLWRSPGVVANLSRTVNMSLGGARVFSDERLRLGTRLHVELLAGADNVIKVLARVVWIDELDAGSPARFDVGLEFLDVPDEMMSRLAILLGKDPFAGHNHPDAPQGEPVWADEEEEPSEKKQ